ncbi:T9SS type A sorting domain-containing protein [bacterium]|nr:T9SS type A sorting domain-containing protein [bacterium]
MGIICRRNSGQNFPNPFNPLTQIQYAISEPVHVILTVYNALGREIGKLVDEKQIPGFYTVNWDGNGQGSRHFDSSLYFYRLQAGQFAAIRKMILIK